MNMITNSDSPKILAAREKIEKARADLQQKIDETKGISKTDSEQIKELLEVLIDAQNEYQFLKTDWDSYLNISISEIDWTFWRDRQN